MEPELEPAFLSPSSSQTASVPAWDPLACGGKVPQESVPRHFWGYEVQETMFPLDFLLGLLWRPSYSHLSGRFFIFFPSFGSRLNRWVWPVYPRWALTPSSLWEISLSSLIQSKVLSLEKGKGGLCPVKSSSYIGSWKIFLVIFLILHLIFPNLFEVKVKYTHFQGVTPGWGHSPATCT